MLLSYIYYPNSWKMDIIETIFSHKDIKAIILTSLLHPRDEGKPILNFTPNGILQCAFSLSLHNGQYPG